MKKYTHFGTLILCVLAAIFPLVISFLGGGDGLVSDAMGKLGGGLGAKFGLPWLTRAGLSDRSDVDNEDDGVGVGGAEFKDVILPPVKFETELQVSFV